MIPPRLKSISGINSMHGHDEMVANVSSVASIPLSTVMTFGLDIHTSTERIVMMLAQLRRRQHGRRFPDNVFKGIFMNENILIPTEISQKFVPNGSINNVPILVQIMAWHRQATSHYLNQLCLDYRRIYASFGPNELRLSALVALMPPVATKLASWPFHHTHYKCQLSHLYIVKSAYTRRMRFQAKSCGPQQRRCAIWTADGVYAVNTVGVISWVLWGCDDTRVLCEVVSSAAWIKEI